MSLPSAIRQQAEELEAEITALRGNTEPEQESEPAPEPIAQAPQDDWEHKYKVLHGKYNAEVPRLTKAASEYSSSINSLQTQINSLTEQLSSAKSAVKNEPKFDHLKADWAELTPLMETVERQQKTIDELNSKMTERLSHVDSQFNTVMSDVKDVRHSVEATESGKFFDRLDQEINGWEVDNTDQRFHAYLAERAPGTTESRQAVIERAQSHLNATPIIEIFQGWRALKGAESKPKPNVMPSKINASSPQGETKRVFSNADVDAFYRDVQRGKYTGKEAEQLRIEREFLAAEREGRIT